jgi:hypothetical protein
MNDTTASPCRQCAHLAERLTLDDGRRVDRCEHCGWVQPVDAGRPHFNAWWRELREIADEDPDGDCAGHDQESFRSMWEDGMSPDDAYQTAWEDARR